MSDTQIPIGHPPTIYNFRPIGDRPGYEPRSRTFTDEQQEGWWTRLTLRPIYGHARVEFIRLANDLKEKHVTGLVDENGALKLNKDKEPIQRPVPIETRWGPVRPDEWFCGFYAKLATMWAGETIPSPISEVAGWMKGTDTAWLEIVAFVGEVEEQPLIAAEKAKEGTAPGNSPGGSTSPGSDDPSAITTNTTRSPDDETPCSAPSNGDNGSASHSSAPSSNPYGPEVRVQYAFADPVPERPERPDPAGPSDLPETTGALPAAAGAFP